MTGAIYLLTELINLIPLFVTLYIFSTYFIINKLLKKQGKKQSRLRPVFIYLLIGR